MSDPWGGPSGQTTRRIPQVPEGHPAGAENAVLPGGPGRRRRGGAGSRRRVKPVRRGRRFLKIAGLCVSVLVVVTAGAGWWFYQHLNGNINSVSMDGKGGTEKADAFGRTPLNLLVIGSDGRTSTQDCKLGGGCSQTGVQSGRNADVEMVVHLSADRTNATVMSVPRDTMTQIPACTGNGQSTSGYYGQINSALQYGPACQVAAVHQLTGIPIDHFIELDFSGVVSMSDAVGGVPVCVDNNVYDTYSHLKLSKGTHTLKGDAALEFLRSRHGFGDGSDLGRTVAQHIFLSSMIRKFKSAGTLTNPSAVYNLADAATKALTVDSGLDSVSKLVSLADDLNKVPTKRMTFTTMQTVPDPSNTNRLLVGPGAKSLFQTIIDDQSLTSGTGKKTAAAGATAKPTPSASSVPASQVAVTVENGTGITGRANTVADALTGKGFSSATNATNAPSPASTTTLTYGSGQQAEAQTAAKALGLPSSHLKQGTGSGLTLVVGSDWTSGTTYPGGSSSSAPANTKKAVSNAHVETANQTNTCAQVSTFQTVELNGVPMTPPQAYADARNTPNSAP